jgi:serine/threonine protein kinase
MYENLCYNCFTEREDSEGSCPFCGYDRAEHEAKYPLALTGGTILAGQYIVGRVLGQGGFGITYLAFDHLLSIKVAIKEFLPEGMAMRMPGTTELSVYTGELSENFSYGAEHFLDEARVLAKFNGHNHIVGVKSFFAENNTSYFVMDYIEGVSFKDYIKSMGGKIDYQDALRVLVPILRALADVHREGFIHRDVTPDNIYITIDGTIKLLDFGSARYNLGDKSKSLDVILKHGYAPKEQYTRRGKQGPFTDVYSVAACFYAAITGFLPPDSLDRVDEDDLIGFSARGVKLPAYLDDAIMKGLEVSAANRFQSAGEFLLVIETEGKQTANTVPTPSPVPTPVPVPIPGPVPVTGSVPITGVTPQPISPPVPTPLTEPEKKPNPFFAWIAKNKVMSGALAAAMLMIIVAVAWQIGNMSGSNDVVPTTTQPVYSPSSQSAPPPSRASSSAPSSSLPDIIEDLPALPQTVVIGGEIVDTSATELDLSEKNLSDISALADLTNLETLYLQENDITDINALKELTNLDWLRLDYNRISDISPLAGLTKLRGLPIDGNNISDISPLQGLTRMESLWLSENNISDISTLKGLTKLENLYLDDNQISDISVLAGLTKLETLYLNDNKVSNVSALMGLTNLTMLTLSNNPLTQSQVDELQEALPNCDISANNLTGTANSATTIPILTEEDALILLANQVEKEEVNIVEMETPFVMESGMKIELLQYERFEYDDGTDVFAILISVSSTIGRIGVEELDFMLLHDGGQEDVILDVPRAIVNMETEEVLSYPIPITEQPRELLVGFEIPSGAEILTFVCTNIYDHASAGPMYLYLPE